MSETSSIVDLTNRVSLLEQALEELSSKIRTQTLKVDTNATVEGELAAGSIKEGGRALDERYQANGEAVNAPSLTVTGNARVDGDVAAGSIGTPSLSVTGNATVSGVISARSVKEGDQTLSEKYQPKGNYLLSRAARVQHGQQHIPSGQQIAQITFQSTFASPPTVLVSQVEATAGFNAVLASRITKAGFDAVKMMNIDGACHVYWIAIGN